MSYESNHARSHLRNKYVFETQKSDNYKKKNTCGYLLKKDLKSYRKNVADNRALLKNFLTSKIKTKKVLAGNQKVITDNSDFVTAFDK